MGYIQEMRRLVGHRPIILAGAGVLLLDEQERLLLIERTDNGCWGIPGGGMEPGECLEDVARRETREEIGLELGELTLFAVFSGPELYYCYPNGDEVYNVSAVYLARYTGNPLRLDPSEHRCFAWFPLAQLPANISPPVRPVLARFVQRFPLCAQRGKSALFSGGL